MFPAYVKYTAASTDVSSTWPIGFVIQAASYGLNILGKHFMRHAGSRGERFCMSWKYAVAFLLLACDVVFSNFALTYASQSIISSCAGLAQVWNCLLAPLTLGEALTVQKATASAIVVVGTVAAAVSVGESSEDLNRAELIALLTTGASIAFYILEAGWLVGATVLAVRGPQHLRAFFFAGVAGAFAGIYFFQTIAVYLAEPCILGTVAECDALVAPDSGYNPLSDPLFYWFVILAVLLGWVVAIGLLSYGLRTYDALYLITMYEAFVVVVGNLNGLLVMGDAQHMTAGQLVAFSISTAVIVLGLLVLLYWPKAWLGDGERPLPPAPMHGLARLGRLLGERDAPPPPQDQDQAMTKKRPLSEASELLPGGPA